ncbi:MAG: hypothetical protein HOV87_07760 [Catenulispora sp.]|nr:hypothetical protein [Catenulispora sp.]
MAEEREEFEDAASLVDAVFGAPAEAEAAEAPEDQATDSDAVDAADVDSDSAPDQADEPDSEAAEPDSEAAEPDDEAAEPDSEVAELDSEAEEPNNEAAATEVTEAAVPDEPAPAVAGTPPKLTRGRLAAAAAVVAGVAVAGAVLLSGGGSGNAATAPTGVPGAPTTTQPSVNPQAFYPVQSATPFTAGGVSQLTDTRIQAAVPGCDSCKLVTRANKFSPDGSVLALLRTGTPQAGKSNAKLVVVGPDGHLVWSAPDGFKALTAGIERFSVDGAGNHYLALPGAKYGQVLVILAWRDGKVQDLGGLLDPKIKSDSIVGVLPQGAGAAADTAATIVSQTTEGVPDADTGGLVESQYRIKDGAPVLTGCRRHVGESGQWLAFAPSPDGCTHWPAGPVGPPDDDDPTAPNP